MTAAEVIREAGRHPWLLLALFVSLPVIAWVLSRVHPRGHGALSPWRYVYAVLVYLSCVPGLLSAVLTGYALFFTRESFLKVDLLVYLLPIASMVVTLVFIRRSVAFADVPGFGRLSGLMLIIGASFVAALIVQKSRIWFFVGAGIGWFLLLAGVVFALLMLGARMLLKRRERPAGQS